MELLPVLRAICAAPMVSGVEAELIGEDDADGRAADGDVDDLAKGGAIGAFCSELCGGIFCSHGRCGPGADPVIGGAAGGLVRRAKRRR